MLDEPGLVEHDSPSDVVVLDHREAVRVEQAHSGNSAGHLMDTHARGRREVGCGQRSAGLGQRGEPRHHALHLSHRLPPLPGHLDRCLH